MRLLRNVLLAMSRSALLRDRATGYAFVRQSVSRFMPGERLDDGLRAAEELRAHGVPTILTRLGENISALAEADEVTAHYLGALEAVTARGLDTHISVKLTHLGLDQSVDACTANLVRLVEAAEKSANIVWIDMESSEYVDRTLDVYRGVRANSLRVGICLQAYLRRTEADLQALIPLGPWIRLVKGAYKEPPQAAFPNKRDVDRNFLRLGERLLRRDARERGARLGIGTHDAALVSRFRDLISREGIAPEHYEVQMLYGIGRPLQQDLIATRFPLRVLVAYGDYWFPWYMRRLAERPANVLFVLRNLVGG